MLLFRNMTGPSTQSLDKIIFLVFFLSSSRSKYSSKDLILEGYKYEAVSVFISVKFLLLNNHRQNHRTMAPTALGMKNLFYHKFNSGNAPLYVLTVGLSVCR